MEVMKCLVIASRRHAARGQRKSARPGQERIEGIRSKSTRYNNYLAALIDTTSGILFVCLLDGE